MKRYHEGFPELIQGVSLSTLENHCASVYAVSEKGELLYVNPAFLDFARENGQPNILQDFPLGSTLGDYIAGPARYFYQQKYRDICSTGQTWNQDYDCSSPTTYRNFRQSTFPLKNGAGVLVVNWPRVELPFPKGRRQIDDRELYLQPDGFIHQCCNCKNVRRKGESETWDTVSQWQREIPSSASHTICPICFDYYWKWPSGHLE